MGAEIPVQILENNAWYWEHHYLKFTAVVDVPAFGYSTYLAKEKMPDHIAVFRHPEPRVDVVTAENLVLENE